MSDMELKLRITANTDGAPAVVQGVTRDVQGLGSALDSTNRQTQQSASGFAQITTAGDEAARALREQRATVAQATIQLRDYAADLNFGTGALERSNVATLQSARVMSAQQQATQQSASALGQLSAAQAAQNAQAANSAGLFGRLNGLTQRVTSSFRVQKGIVQQAGFQFQDLAVQIGAGTSAFVAFGQQAPQLLGFLGPGGAILGGVVAVASIVGGILYSSLGDAEDATDALADSLERLDNVVKSNDGVPELAREIRELAEVSALAAEARIESGILAAESAAKAAAGSIRDAFDSVADTAGLSDLSDFFSQDIASRAKLFYTTGQFLSGATTPAKELQNAVDDLAESLGLAGEDGNTAAREIFEALRQLDATPTTENFTALENTIAGIARNSGKTSDVLKALVGDLGEFFDSARDAEERAKFLQERLEKLSKGEGLEQPDGGRDTESRDRLIESFEEELALLERQQSLLQSRLSVKQAAAAAERELRRERLQSAGIESERIEKLFSLEDAIDAASAAERKRQAQQKASDSVAEELTRLQRQQKLIKSGTEATEAAAVAERELRREKLISSGVDAQRVGQLLALEQTIRSTVEAEKEAARTQADLERSAQSLINELDPLGAEFESLYQKQQLLIAASSAGLISPARRDSLIEQLVTGFAQGAEQGGDEAADKFENRFSSAAQTVSQALQNAIAAGDWDTLGEGIGNAIATTAAAAVSEQISQSLASSVSAESGLLAQAGAAFAGPIAGAVVGGAVQLAIRELDDYFSDNFDPTAQRQATQGTGSVLGDINAKSLSIQRAVEGTQNSSEQLVGINRSMLTALQTVQNGITGASGLIARDALGQDFGVRTGSTLTESQQQAAGLGALFPGAALGSAATLLSNPAFGIPALLFGDDIAGDIVGFVDDLTFGLLGKIGKALGGKTKKKDEGIRIIGGRIADLVDDTLVEAYGTFRTKKNFLDDYDTFERRVALDEQVSNQFEAVFGGIFDSVEAGANALGLLPARTQAKLNSFVLETTRISLEDLNPEEQRAELEAVFGKVFDDLVGVVVPFAASMQRAGEGLGETLARVATQVQVAQEAADRLNFDFDPEPTRFAGLARFDLLPTQGVFSDLEAAKVARLSEALVEAAGGVDQFLGSMQSFIRNFYTEAEQFTLAQSDITRALEQQGLALPETRAGYVDLLQAQNGATESGREAIATLLRLQSAADEYYTRLEDQQEEAHQAELRAQEEARRAAEDARRAQLDLLNEQRRTTGERLASAEAAAQSVTDALKTLNGLNADPLASQSQSLQTLRDIAASGVVTPGDRLNSALTGATQIDQADFATLADYVRQISLTGNVLNELDGITQEQVTVEQQMLNSLDRQIELLEEGNAEQVEAIVNLQAAVDRNTAAVAGSGTASAAPVARQSSQVLSVDGLERLISELAAQLEGSQLIIARHTQRAARILERIEIDGIEVRQ